MEMASSAGAIIDGKRIAAEVRRSVREHVADLTRRELRPPRLALILVGDDPASHIYVRNKSRACERAGIAYLDIRLPEDTPGERLLEQVDELNHDDTVDGILVQLPLPGPLRHLEPAVMERVEPSKDVDGFHPENMGRLLLGQPGFVACTPLGILFLLEQTGVPLEGAHAVVIGRSVTVGRPVAALLLHRHATVTICHSRTLDLPGHVRRADIVVAAAGKPNLVRGDWIKPGAAVIDVGINRTEQGLVGDVVFDEARQRASHITPVPGGVGPMTIAMLLQNTLRARTMHR